MQQPRLRTALALIALVLTACGSLVQVAPTDGSQSSTPLPVSQSPARSQPRSPEASEGSSERLTARPLKETAAPLGYYEYLPPDYGDGELRPLLVFVHGIGESGDGTAAGLDRLLANAIPQLIHTDKWPNDRPFVVLAPQHDEPTDDEQYATCEQGQTWGPCVLGLQHELGHPADGSLCMTPTELHDFLSYAIPAYDVDPERVYLTGLSCGAFASFEYAAEYGPSQIAAMVVIAGEGRHAWNAAGCELGQVAIWAFHGDSDADIAVDGSIEPMTRLMECPSPPRREAKLTVYPNVDHDSWTRTYDGSAGHDIYAWLLQYSVP